MDPAIPVCRTWYRVIQDEYLWKLLFVRDYGLAPHSASWRRAYQERYGVDHNWAAAKYSIIPYPRPNTVHSCVVLHGDYVFLGGGKQRAIGMYDLRSGQLVRAFEGAKEEVSCMCVTPDGYLYAGATDRRVRAWDIQQGHHVLSIRLNPVPSAICVHEGHIIVGCVNGAVQLWDRYSGQALFTQNFHSKAVHAVQVHPLTLHVVTAAADGDCHVLELSPTHLRKVATLHHDSAVLQASFYLAASANSGRAERAVRLPVSERELERRRRRQQQQQQQRNHTAGTNTASGSLLRTAAGAGSATGAAAAAAGAGAGAGAAAMPAPPAVPLADLPHWADDADDDVFAGPLGDSIVYTVSLDRRVRIWDWRRDECIELVSHSDWVMGLRSLQGLFVTAGLDATLRVWSRVGRRLYTVRLGVPCLALDADATRAVLLTERTEPALIVVDFWPGRAAAVRARLRQERVAELEAAVPHRSDRAVLREWLWPLLFGIGFAAVVLGRWWRR